MASTPKLPAPPSPARFAAYLSAALGLALLGYGLSTFGRAHPPALPLSIALTLAGALDLALGWFLHRRSRAAWSFATSLNGTAFVVFLFASFKVRDLAGIPLAFAMLPCFIFGAATVLLALSYEDFE